MEHFGLIRRFLAFADIVRHGLMPIRRHEFQGVVADHLAARIADDRQQRLVDVGKDAVLVKKDSLGGGGGEFAHALLAVANRLLGQVVAGDVVDQHKGADLRTLGVEVRHQVDLDVALLARGQDLRTDVFDLFAAAHPRNVSLDQRPCRLADRLAHGLADDGVDGPAVGVRVLAVGENALESARVVIGDQRGDLVRDGAQECFRRGFRVVHAMDPARACPAMRRVAGPYLAVDCAGCDYALSRLLAFAATGLYDSQPAPRANLNRGIPA